jgi:predicted Fe-Mo cluster-binding NifX family protein
MKKLMIPIEESNGENSIISDHFGRAPYFAVIEISDNNFKIIDMVKNVGEHFGGHGRAAPLILNQKPDILIVKGMGTRALQIFNDNGIEVLSTEASIVKEAIKSYLDNRLINLTEPCEDSKHHI